MNDFEDFARPYAGMTPKERAQRIYEDADFVVKFLNDTVVPDGNPNLILMAGVEFRAKAHLYRDHIFILDKEKAP